MGPTLGPECTSFPIPPNKPNVWPQGQESAFWGGLRGSIGVFLQLFSLASKQGKGNALHPALPHAADRQSHSLLLLTRMSPANKQEETSSGQQSPSPVNVSPGPALLSPWELGNTSGVKIVPAKSAAKPCSWTSCMTGFFFCVRFI